MGASKPGAGQIVLVVDDEPLQRMMVSDMLYDAGYWAVEAADAEQALRMLESRKDIRLVFTDVKMNHGMDGLELAAAVRRRWPHIAIVVTSGKMHEPDRALPDKAVFFPKPYRSQEIVPVLHRMTA